MSPTTQFLVTLATDATVRQHEMPVRQIAMLLMIFDAEDDSKAPGILAADLTRSLGAHQSIATKAINRMVALGLVERGARRDSTDRRRNTLTLTASGKETCFRIREAFEIGK